MTKAIVGALLLATFAGCSLAPAPAPAPVPVEDFGTRLRRECESVWEQLKGDPAITRLDIEKEREKFVLACILKRAM